MAKKYIAIGLDADGDVVATELGQDTAKLTILDKKMKTYILTDETWHRGQGSLDSYVKPPSYIADAPRCCLGNVVQQEEGWDDKCSTGRPDLPASLEKLLLVGDPEIGTVKSSVYSIYQANDEPGLSDTERVAKINAIAEPFGFRFEFRQDA
jgi:hypothetical protein